MKALFMDRSRLDQDAALRLGFSRALKPQCVRLLLPSLFVALGAVGPHPNANAQDKFPTRAVEVILPYPAGGGVDVIARAFARLAAQTTGQPWTVVNRDGAGGLVGFTALSKAALDGYTVVFSPASPLTNSPFVSRVMPFRTEQIEPVCQVFENVFALVVRPESSIKSMADLLAQGRSQPGKLAYGHAGPASVGHLAVAAIEKAKAVKFNSIPYRGDAPMLPQLMSGELDFGVPAISSIAGKGLRVLGVFSEKRHPSLPDVPTVAEAGLPTSTPGLNGLYVPAGTPRPTLDRLEAICENVVQSDDFRRAAQTLQQIPTFLTAAEFKARIDRTFKAHANLVPALNLEKN